MIPKRYIYTALATTAVVALSFAPLSKERNQLSRNLREEINDSDRQLQVLSKTATTTTATAPTLQQKTATATTLQQKTATATTTTQLYDQKQQAVQLSPGVNGDPLIMGLAGQVFKFEGRSGAWYSAISTPAFQWNLKTTKFEGCPADADTFTSGAGLSVLGRDGSTQHRIQVNVVNEYEVNTGCGMHAEKDNDYACLGAGSLEIVVDGHKIVRPVDMPLGDNSGRVVAFNTISRCARQWFDFDPATGKVIGLDQQQAHSSSADASKTKGRFEGAGAFDVLESNAQALLNREACAEWTNTRRLNGDILQQTGTWSTVLIETEMVTLQVEYHQEWDRCDAHNIDVWIIDVHPDLANEEWAGIIGETKDDTISVGEVSEPNHMKRSEALKFPHDEDYEVISPFSTSCKACVTH